MILLHDATCTAGTAGSSHQRDDIGGRQFIQNRVRAGQQGEHELTNPGEVLQGSDLAAAHLRYYAVARYYVI